MKTNSQDSNKLKIIEANFVDKRPTKFLEELNPKNVLYFRHCIDVNYDRPSEDMGSFFDVIYLEGDQPKIAWGNPGDYAPIKEFLKRAKSILTVEYDFGTGQEYHTSESDTDFKWKGDTLVYKNKYGFKLS